MLIVLCAGKVTPYAIERKYFTFPSWESNPRRWIHRQTLYHVAVKARYSKAVEVYNIYLDLVAHMQV